MNSTYEKFRVRILASLAVVFILACAIHGALALVVFFFQLIGFREPGVRINDYLIITSITYGLVILFTSWGFWEMIKKRNGNASWMFAGFAGLAYSCFEFYAAPKFTYMSTEYKIIGTIGATLSSLIIVLALIGFRTARRNSRCSTKINDI